MHLPIVCNKSDFVCVLCLFWGGIARKYDYANYLCALHLPPAPRAAAFALRAFNIETAQAGDSREMSLAMMRLVWWRDAIDGIYKRLLEHPVVQALGSVITEHRLSKHWFTRLLEARSLDLDMATSPTNISEIERYAEDTSSALLYLTLEAAGVRNTAADHAASHIGKSAGLALLLRASPYHAARRRSYIPLDVAAKHGLAQEDLYRGKNLEALSSAVHEVASAASAHLEKARSLSGTIPAAAKPVLLPAVPTGVLLDTLQKVDFNVFDPTLTRGVCGISPLWMQLQLKWNSYKGTY
ncbi:hypothetical protein CY35_06G023700 [Sphagnum magellanicum]|nr:hypothetical protein CY35_06G023700 [Sphagnum magellanicum]